MNHASLINLNSILLLGGASLLPASCAITQESRMNLKAPSSLCGDLSSTVMERKHAARLDTAISVPTS